MHDLAHVLEMAETITSDHERAPMRASTSRLGAGLGLGQALLGLRGPGGGPAGPASDEGGGDGGASPDVDGGLDDPFGMHLLDEAGEGGEHEGGEHEGGAHEGGEHEGGEHEGGEQGRGAGTAGADVGGASEDQAPGPISEDDDLAGDGEDELREATRGLADIIASGESKIGKRKGDEYKAANSGTRGGRIVGSRIEQGLTRMTIGQIRSRRAGGGRLFAMGKYQIVQSLTGTDTLGAAIRSMGIKSSEVFDESLQDRIFVEFLLFTKQPQLAGYLKSGAGSLEDAVHGAAKEWASIEVPAGRRTAHGVSSGHASYYGGANSAHKGSGPRVRAGVERMRKAIVAVFGPAPLTRDKVKQVAAIAAGRKGERDRDTTSPTTSPTGPTAPTVAGASAGGGLSAPTEDTGASSSTGVLTGSVGRGGANQPADVGRVQERLAAMNLSPGPIDQKVGPRTIGAIEAAQRSFGFQHPDGLVEPGKRTERGLFGGQGAVVGVAEAGLHDHGRAEADRPTAPTAPTAPTTPTTAEQTTPTAPTTPTPTRKPVGKPLPTRPGVIMTPHLTEVSAVLAPYMPRGTVVSSAVRSNEKQRKILRGQWARCGGPPSITDEVAQSQWLARVKGVRVAAPGHSNHEKGKALDLAGAGLSSIEAAVDKARSEHSEAGIGSTLLEDKNGCVHVNLKSAS